MHVGSGFEFDALGAGSSLTRALQLRQSRRSAPMVGRSLAVAALALGLSARQADAHGAVTIPMPREAIDGDTAPWNGKVPWPIPFGASSPCPSSGQRAHQLTELARADNPNWCAHPSAEAAGKDPRNLTGSLGQACFWFSNGCGIGSPECDGNSGQLVPCCTRQTFFPATPAPHFGSVDVCQAHADPLAQQRMHVGYADCACVAVVAPVHCNVADHAVVRSARRHAHGAHDEEAASDTQNAHGSN